MRLVASTVLAVLLSFSAAAAADSVILKPQATVTAGPVKLAAVADISGQQAESLGAITIAHMPPGRNCVSLSRARILSAIKTVWKQDLELSGAEIVQLNPQLVTVSGDELVKIYVARVMQLSPWRATGRIEISSVRTPEAINVLPADLKNVTADFAPREDFLGQVSLDLKFGKTQIIRLCGNVKVYAAVPVSRGIAARQPITASDLDTKELELSAYGNVIQTPQQCEGLRAKAPIRAGQPLLRAQLEPIPIICRGEVVQIEAVGANFVITDSGQALKDGFTSERIPIKNQTSGRTIIGTVIAPSRVRVVF